MVEFHSDEMFTSPGWHIDTPWPVRGAAELIPVDEDVARAAALAAYEARIAALNGDKNYMRATMLAHDRATTLLELGSDSADHTYLPSATGQLAATVVHVRNFDTDHLAAVSSVIDDRDPDAPVERYEIHESLPPGDPGEARWISMDAAGNLLDQRGLTSALELRTWLGDIGLHPTVVRRSYHDAAVAARATRADEVAPVSTGDRLLAGVDAVGNRMGAAAIAASDFLVEVATVDREQAIQAARIGGLIFVAGALLPLLLRGGAFVMHEVEKWEAHLLGDDKATAQCIVGEARPGDHGGIVCVDGHDVIVIPDGSDSSGTQGGVPMGNQNPA